MAVWLSEPTTLTFGDGLWFSFETVSTIGFGDIPAETPVARVITVVLSVISIFYIAMLTGVAVSYCNMLIKMHQKDTMARFMDDLEHLEELDRDELADLSRRVREYRRRQR
ncbi:MAG: potassium channel family protein [Collinsella sp.]|nr:potassium channel family protein [Collinsella sp.]